MVGLARGSLESGRSLDLLSALDSSSISIVVSGAGGALRIGGTGGRERRGGEEPKSTSESGHRLRGIKRGLDFDLVNSSKDRSARAASALQDLVTELERLRPEVVEVDGVLLGEWQFGPKDNLATLIVSA